MGIADDKKTHGISQFGNCQYPVNEISGWKPSIRGVGKRKISVLSWVTRNLCMMWSICLVLG